MPAGSITGGWKYHPKVIGGPQPFADQLTHKAGIVACPTDGEEWAIYVKVPGFHKKHCLGFDFEAMNTTGIAAWEYL